jgi:hypothetical protein
MAASYHSALHLSLVRKASVNDSPDEIPSQTQKRLVIRTAGHRTGGM